MLTNVNVGEGRTVRNACTCYYCRQRFGKYN